MPFQFKPMPQIFPNQRIWGCAACGYTFVITEEQGRYTVSAKQGLSRPHDGKRIDLGGFEQYNSFDEAQQACVDFVYRKN